jgi:hypothetical protein
MRFEARELKPYRECVRAADLVVGRVYFRVMFIDADMVVPELEALVFIGHDLHVEGPGMYYQDVRSYLEGTRFDPDEMNPFPLKSGIHGVSWERNGCWFEMERKSEVSDLEEYDQALDTLLRCSIERRSWDGVVRRIPASQ